LNNFNKNWNNYGNHNLTNRAYRRSSFAFVLLIANNGTTFRTSNFNRLASNVTFWTCDGRAPDTTQLLFTPKVNRPCLDPIRVKPQQAAMIDIAGTLAAELLL
jgi:hypothetical protein